jgi:putative endonuclease
MLPYCVYVLRSLKDADLYVGFTTHLSQRLGEHNAGRTPSTARRRPLVLIFCEYYVSRGDAMRRERYFKTSAGKWALKMMLRETLGEP